MDRDLAAMMRRVVAVALSLVAAQAGAQSMHGVVRDSASGRGLPGVVLILLDGAGAPIGRTLTDFNGTYRFRDAARASELRAQRLGYRPRNFDVPAPVGGEIRLDFAAASLPRLLERVDTRVNPLCPRRKDEADAFALWNQARSGLLASIITREASPAKYRIIRYQRLMIGSTDRVAEQRVRLHDVAWSGAFAAVLAPATFVKSGFRTEHEGDFTYFGPDAEILLAEPFQVGYCFSIASARARRSQIGLHFTPATPQRNRVDIDGTLWIDTVAREMRDIEFRYLNIGSNADRFRPGGRVTFRSMSNGAVFADAYTLRMLSRELPAFVGGATRGGRAGDIGDASFVQQQSWGVTEGGGEVARAVWQDGTTWRGRYGTVRLEAVNELGDPMVGIRFKLDSTDYMATTDSTGVAVIDDLLPGPYTTVVYDPVLATIGVELQTKVSFIASRDSTIHRQVRVRGAQELIGNACKGLSPNERARTRIIVVRVVTPDGKPVNEAHWSVSATTPGLGGLTGATVAPSRSGVTGSDGLFTPCGGVPPEVRVEINVARRGEAPVREFLTPNKPVTAIRIVLPDPVKKP